MAKSLRSKRMRRNRAVKRESIYGPRELARLKRTVVGLADATTPESAAAADAEMREIANVRAPADVVKEMAEKKLQRQQEQGESAYDAKTMQNAHGCYPLWMNQRRIRQHQARLRKGGGPDGSSGGSKKTTARSTAPKRGGGGKKRPKKKSVW